MASSSSSSSSSSSGLTFKVHPLVIVNISDHYTRMKAQSQSQKEKEGSSTRVFGCVIGVQRGRTVEIFNSFELLYDDSAGCLERAFLEKKQELYKKVFPQFYILGWYSTGSDATEWDMVIHKSLMDINESPVYVVLNPVVGGGQKELPLSIFESEVHLIEGVPQALFVRAAYSIETVEAERISVDHVAHLKPSDGTQLGAHLTALHSAIKMLHSRIALLHRHLSSIPSSPQPHHHSLLRQLSSLLRSLPALDSPNFHNHFLTEYNDTLLIAYLAIFTNCSTAMNDLADKFNIAYDRHTRRGGRTTFF